MYLAPPIDLVVKGPQMFVCIRSTDPFACYLFIFEKKKSIISLENKFHM